MWAEAEAGSGSGPFSVEAEAEARKFYRFRFHIGVIWLEEQLGEKFLSISGCGLNSEVAL